MPRAKNRMFNRRSPSQRPRSPSQVQQVQTPSSQAAESCFKLIIYPLLRTKLAELIGGEMAFEGAGSC